MSSTTASALPRVVSRTEWLEARKHLLATEKSLTRALDAASALRRRLPMVRVDGSYQFMGPAGLVSFVELFEDRRQLYVHHFMWSDDSQRFCPGCTAAAEVSFDNPAFRAYLAERDVTFVAISRAPFAQIKAYQKSKGWTFPWYSSEGTSFNLDFHATLDESRAPIEFNYRNKEELIAAGFSEDSLKGDWPANSVFLRDGDTIYHTYSAFARGLDQLFLPNPFLDLTPYGRQEGWEDSPAGWPQRPTYG